MSEWLNRIWYEPDAPGRSALLPLTGLYRLLIGTRRWLYRLRVLPVRRLPVPVIVVGNVTVGGTGKTPMVLWLAQWLTAAGWRPGIVSRGYGGRAGRGPQPVHPDSEVRRAGDEALMMARRSAVPVMVGADRAAAAAALVAQGVDIVISDDGLQHHRLGRDVEIAVVDGERGLGNGRCLPAGPLREPASRLDEVDAVVINGGVARRPGNLRMRLAPAGVYRVGGRDRRDLASFAGQTVHAVAGIGNPQRFFAQLREAGLQVIEHPLRDHAPISPEMVTFNDDVAVMMTEKDAVKCQGYAGEGLWFLRVDAQFGDDDSARLAALLGERLPKPGASGSP